MQFENSVRNAVAPWFMDENQVSKRLGALSSDVRPHAEELIRDGVTKIRGSISKEICVDLIKRFKAFAKANPEKFAKYLDRDGHYPRIINLHAALPELQSLFIKNKKALDVQRAMFDAPPSLYTSLFYERGSAQDFHRDTPYFSTRPEYFYFGVWVALEDADERNGALKVIRGGHKIPESDRAAIVTKIFPNGDVSNPLNPLASNSLWDAYQADVRALCNAAGLKEELLTAEAGDTIIWHPQLPHGGSPIGDLRRSRFSLVMHTTPLGVPVYHMDKFFRPDVPAPLDSGYDYVERDGVYVAQHNAVDFGHQEAFPVESFTMPEPASPSWIRKLIGSAS
jgi:phytanoyl-CoA hydroxylase